MSEEEIPTYNKEQLCAFMTAKQLAGVRFPELLPTMPKFLIHVPRIEDGGEMITFTNIKEAVLRIQDSGTTMEVIRGESMPQKVAINGEGWIAVNACKIGHANMWTQHLSEVWKSGKYKNNRRGLIEDLLYHIQNFKIDFIKKDGKMVVDKITVNPATKPDFTLDIYSMPQKDKDMKYEEEPHQGTHSAGKIAGLFYKKPEPYKTFFIKGHFKVEYDRGDSWHQVQEYRKGAYITIDPRGEISSIDPSNMDSSYGFLKEGVEFKDIQTGRDRSQYVDLVSDNKNKIPEFTQAEVNGTIALHSMGYSSRGASRTRV